MKPRKEPKILLLDIETLPDMTAVMSHFTELSNYPGLTLKAGLNSVICFGYKWFDEKEIHCLNAWDYRSWSKDVNDDKEILEDILKIVDDADCVVTHNGKRFDWKFIQTRLLKHNLPNLKAIPHVDTCNEMKKNLFLFNNRLNTAAKFMGLEEKLENGGWSLWQKVLNRDQASMKLMTKYCKQDVNVLNDVFKRLRPFVKNIPNYNLYGDGTKCCPSCGSTRLNKDGFRASKTNLYQRLRCRDCGSVCQLPHNSELPR